MRTWKLLFNTKTPTWEKFGCVEFAEGEQDAAFGIATAAARAEYPGAEIHVQSFEESTPAAAAAYAARRRRMEDWLENTRTGRPNDRTKI